MGGAKYLAGHFLIAENELGDPNFVQTVVLIVTHDDQGAFGLIVNRRTEYTLGEAAPSYRESAFAGMPLFVGGPVEQEYLFCLHSGLPEGKGGDHQIMVRDGIVFEPEFTVVQSRIVENPEQRPPEIRLFAGYSGWSAGQLEDELAEKAWTILPASPDLVFLSNPEQGWHEALKRKGGVYWALAQTGYKPSLN